MAETAIVVIVPEGEPVVRRWQREPTRAGADGMPPHVTLLIPFADSESLPLAEVGEVLCEFTPLAFALTELRRFAGRTAVVLWLAPEPAAPFRCSAGSSATSRPRCRSQPRLRAFPSSTASEDVGSCTRHSRSGGA